MHHDSGPNFTTFEFTSNGGGGRMVFSTRTFTNSGENVRHDEFLDALDALEAIEGDEMLTDFDEEQFRGFRGPPNGPPNGPFGRPQGMMGMENPPNFLQPSSLQE